MKGETWITESRHIMNADDSRQGTRGQWMVMCSTVLSTTIIKTPNEGNIFWKNGVYRSSRFSEAPWQGTLHLVWQLVVASHVSWLFFKSSPIILLIESVHWAQILVSCLPTSWQVLDVENTNRGALEWRASSVALGSLWLAGNPLMKCACFDYCFWNQCSNSLWCPSLTTCHMVRAC